MKMSNHNSFGWIIGEWETRTSTCTCNGDLLLLYVACNAWECNSVHSATESKSKEDKERTHYDGVEE